MIEKYFESKIQKYIVYFQNKKKTKERASQLNQTLRMRNMFVNYFHLKEQAISCKNIIIIYVCYYFFFA